MEYSNFSECSQRGNCRDRSMTGPEYKTERKRRNLSQVALAALIEVRQGTISDRETDRIKITKEAELAIKSLPLAEEKNSKG